MILQYLPTAALAAVAGVFLLAGHQVRAQAPDLSKNTLKDWTLGDIVSGGPLTQEGLEGKVVVIEYWGVR